MWMCVSLRFYVSWTFSLALLTLISLFLLYLVLFYYYFFRCLFLLREKVGIWMSGEVRRIWGGSGKGETIITRHSIFKNLFSVKNKKKSLSIQNRGNVFWSSMILFIFCNLNQHISDSVPLPIYRFKSKCPDSRPAQPTRFLTQSKDSGNASVWFPHPFHL